MPGESKDFATTTPVHGPGIKADFCRLLFSKERDVHRPAAGCQVVVGAETEGRKEDRCDRTAIPVPCGKRNPKPLGCLPPPSSAVPSRISGFSHQLSTLQGGHMRFLGFHNELLG